MPVMCERDLQAQSPGVEVGQRRIRVGPTGRCDELGPPIWARGRDPPNADDQRIGRIVIMRRSLELPRRFDRNDLRRGWCTCAADDSRGLLRIVGFAAPELHTRRAAIIGERRRNTCERWQAGPEQANPHHKQCNHAAQSTRLRVPIRMLYASAVERFGHPVAISQLWRGRHLHTFTKQPNFTHTRVPGAASSMAS